MIHMVLWKHALTLQWKLHETHSFSNTYSTHGIAFPQINSIPLEKCSVYNKVVMSFYLVMLHWQSVKSSSSVQLLGFLGGCCWVDESVQCGDVGNRQML